MCLQAYCSHTGVIYARYMCRWHPGDVSFVWASNKDDAVFKLDEQGNAETCPLIVGGL